MSLDKMAAGELVADYIYIYFNGGLFIRRSFLRLYISYILYSIYPTDRQAAYIYIPTTRTTRYPRFIVGGALNPYMRLRSDYSVPVSRTGNTGFVVARGLPPHYHDHLFDNVIFLANTFT